jgi:hypothetical protein
MRKIALLVAVVLAAALSAPSSSYAAKKADPALAAQKNTADFMRDATNPYMAKDAAVKKKAVKKKAVKKKAAKKKAKKAKKKK